MRCSALDIPKMVALDPRINAFRPELAAKHLQGQVEAKRFVEGVQRSVVMAIGIKRESKRAVGLGVRRIQAERGARFGKSVLSLIGSVKEVRKLAVCFGKARRQPQ